MAFIHLGEAAIAERRAPHDNNAGLDEFRAALAYIGLMYLVGLVGAPIGIGLLYLGEQRATPRRRIVPSEWPDETATRRTLGIADNQEAPQPSKHAAIYDEVFRCPIGFVPAWPPFMGNGGQTWCFQWIQSWAQEFIDGRRAHRPAGRNDVVLEHPTQITVMDPATRRPITHGIPNRLVSQMMQHWDELVDNAHATIPEFLQCGCGDKNRGENEDEQCRWRMLENPQTDLYTQLTLSKKCVENFLKRPEEQNTSHEFVTNFMAKSAIEAIQQIRGEGQENGVVATRAPDAHGDVLV